MKLSPDQTIFWQRGFITINLTIVTTWALMLLLVIGSILITRKLKTGIKISRWQCILEMLVTGMNKEIKGVGLNKPEQYIGFIGTLFLFIAVSNICIIFPFYDAPTGSLSKRTREVAPGVPVAPVAPRAPVAPVAPCGPCGPVAPVAPVAPCGPCVPLLPLHTRVVDDTSALSSTPLRFWSSPNSIVDPPAAHWLPGAIVVTRAAPFTPLRMVWTQVWVLLLQT